MRLDPRTELILAFMAYMLALSCMLALVLYDYI